MKKALRTLSIATLVAATVVVLLSLIHMAWTYKGITMLIWGAYMLIASRFLWILGDEGEKKK